MALLKIYSVITDDECEAMFFEDFGGPSPVTYTDIRAFLDSIPADDDRIDIRLHCDGGDCVAGWSIYDALRQTNKIITATIEGKCSSIATIILLAAPKERRYAYRNASMCIHDPALSDYWLPDERLTPDTLQKEADKLQTMAVQLQIETDKILDLYVERTGTDRAVLAAIMKKDMYIDMQTALDLGFIGSILPEISDSKKPKSRNSKQKRERIMDKNKKIECNAAAVERACKLFNVEKLEDLLNLKIVDQLITSASGETFTVVREEGDPQVGDEAYPDGNYVMDDGSTIVVQAGVITSITKEGDEAPDPNANPDEGTQPLTPEQQQAIINDLQAQLDALKESVALKDSEIEALKTEKANLEAAKEETAVTDDQKEILTIVDKAGGKAWLDKVIGMNSTFTPQNRKFVAHKDVDQQDSKKETKTQRLIREAREANAKRRNAGKA